MSERSDAMTIPPGDDTITLSRIEYEDLVDARDHAIAMRDVASGAPTLSEAELDDFLAAKTPLAFWRRRAGLTQGRLAELVGISQAFLSQLELGLRTGSIGLHAKLARALGVRIEDLVNEDDGTKGL
jgi:DNA-binding XRE family transcriptional regulator